VTTSLLKPTDTSAAGEPRGDIRDVFCSLLH